MSISYGDCMGIPNFFISVIKNYLADLAEVLDHYNTRLDWDLQIRKWQAKIPKETLWPRGADPSTQRSVCKLPPPRFLFCTLNLQPGHLEKKNNNTWSGPLFALREKKLIQLRKGPAQHPGNTFCPSFCSGSPFSRFLSLFCFSWEVPLKTFCSLVFFTRFSRIY